MKRSEASAIRRIDCRSISAQKRKHLIDMPTTSRSPDTWHNNPNNPNNPLASVDIGYSTYRHILITGALVIALATHHAEYRSHSRVRALARCCCCCCCALAGGCVVQSCIFDVVVGCVGGSISLQLGTHLSTVVTATDRISASVSATNQSIDCRERESHMYRGSQLNVRCLRTTAIHLTKSLPSRPTSQYIGNPFQ
jgi:hypothetical protein